MAERNSTPDKLNKLNEDLSSLEVANRFTLGSHGRIYLSETDKVFDTYVEANDFTDDLVREAEEMLIDRHYDEFSAYLSQLCRDKGLKLIED